MPSEGLAHTFLFACQAKGRFGEETAPCQPGFHPETYTFTVPRLDMKGHQWLGRGKRPPVLHVPLPVAPDSLLGGGEEVLKLMVIQQPCCAC